MIGNQTPVAPRNPAQDDDQIGQFGSMDAVIGPLMEQMFGQPSGGMGVQAPPNPMMGMPRDLSSLQSLFSGQMQKPGQAAVPHYRQQLHKTAKSTPNGY